MNKVILIGRLTKDPEIRYTQGNEPMCIARYTLAVDRRTKEKATDFISCVAFGKNGQFAEKYLNKGTKIALEGRIQTGSYTRQDGQKVYTTDVVVDSTEFAESKGSKEEQPTEVKGEGFVQVPEGEDDFLPFN